MSAKCLIVICLLVIAAISLFLWLVEPYNFGNIIQADAIIALVFITGFYAKQTEELVKQEQLSLKEEKKRLEDKLRKFYEVGGEK